MYEERFTLETPARRYVLNGTFRPQQLAPTTVSFNLVRARNSTKIHDLGDGLPDPAPIVLTGEMRAKTEDELSLLLRDLRDAVNATTGVTRNERTTVAIQGRSMIAAPISDNSGECSVTLTFIPVDTPSTSGGLYDW